MAVIEVSRVSKRFKTYDRKEASGEAFKTSSGGTPAR